MHVCLYVALAVWAGVTWAVVREVSLLRHTMRHNVRTVLYK